MKKGCVGCIFFKENDKNEFGYYLDFEFIGECRRNPRSTCYRVTGNEVHIGSEVRHIFPKVYKDDWCGEFKKIINEKKNK